ncbi:MAG: methionine synthase [Planctomycetota bacterium]
MADIKVLDAIPFAPDAARLMEQLHIAAEAPEAAEFRTLLDRLKAVARPRALYGVAFIDRQDEGSVTVDGVTFTSRVLAHNLAGLHRVFPYIASCGPEMDRVVDPAGDYLIQFWIDAVKADALMAARAFLVDHLTRTFATGKLSSMNPGSGDIDVWPIEEQRVLFGYFGDTEKLIGVRLTPSCLMVPNKSVSGIFFPREVSFTTCRLCHRKDCPGRKADFDPHEAEKYQHP